jgi:hypothetical protein
LAWRLICACKAQQSSSLPLSSSENPLKGQGLAATLTSSWRMTRCMTNRNEAPEAALVGDRRKRGNRMRHKIQVIFAAIGLSSGAALAQSSPGAPGSDQTIPEKVQGAQIKNAVPLTSGRSESLSDKLNSSDGVIKPKPGVDPGMMKTAPVSNPNSTLVIPPPGTPGGAPGAEVK